MKIIIWQTLYLTAAAALLPFSPALYLQGQRTRRRIGVLPGASGPTKGVAIADGISSESKNPASLFVIGESTVAGLGASTHEYALAGQFARNLSQHIGRPVEWNVVGKNGVTARQTINELLPQMPDKKYDFILIGLGGNDVLKLSSPIKWRHDMLELLGLLPRKAAKRSDLPFQLPDDKAFAGFAESDTVFPLAAFAIARCEYK